MDIKKIKNKTRQGFYLPTLDWEVKASSYCFKSSGGAMLSISAPSTAMGTFTPEINLQIPVNYDTKLLFFFFLVLVLLLENR